MAEPNPTFKSCYLQTSAPGTSMPTVNVSTVAPDKNDEWMRYIQQPYADPNHEWPNFLVGLTGAGPFKNGLKTIYIPGFTGAAPPSPSGATPFNGATLDVDFLDGWAFVNGSFVAPS